MNSCLSIAADEEGSRRTFDDFSLIWITLGVIAFHFLLIVYYTEDSKIVLPIKPAAKVVVKTVKLKEEPKKLPSMAAQPAIEEFVAAVEQKETALPKNDLQPTQTPVKEKEEKSHPKVKNKEEKPQIKVESKKKAVAAPKEKPKGESLPKKETPKQEVQKGKVDDQKKQLLRKAQESIAKIDKTSDKVMAKAKEKRTVGLVSPGPVEALTIDTQHSVESGLSRGESLYRNQLSAQLKMFLRLPEQGKVEVRLTLLRSGHVAKVQIIGSESEINSSYVKTALPELTFSPFGVHFGKEKQYTFHITLTNE